MPPVSIRTVITFAGAAFTALTLGGCQYFDRMGQCRSLSGVVNPALASIDRDRKKDPRSEAIHREISRRYGALADAVGRLSIRDRRVAEVSTEYQKLFREAGRDASVYADALGTHDENRATLARGLATRTLKHEAQLAGKLTAACNRR